MSTAADNSTPAAGAAPAGSPPPAVSAPAASQSQSAATGHSDEAVKAREAKAADKARAALLAELEIDDPEKAKTLIKSAKDAEAKNLSELERERAAFATSEKARDKAEKKAAEQERELSAAKLELTLVRAGVKPDETDVAAILISKARDAAGKDFDEAKALADLRVAKPYLFAAAAGNAPAQTSPFGVPAAAPPAPAGAHLPVFDAMTATPEQIRHLRTTGQIPNGFRLPS